jgi:hypothetical protein
MTPPLLHTYTPHVPCCGESACLHTSSDGRGNVPPPPGYEPATEPNTPNRKPIRSEKYHPPSPCREQVIVNRCRALRIIMASDGLWDLMTFRYGRAHICRPHALELLRCRACVG